MIKYLYILYKKIADRVAPESEENLASFPLVNYEISIGDNAMNLSNHPLRAKYDDLKNRCYNKNNTSYKWYGGRGIKVCDEWKNNFKSFYDWAIENNWQKGLQIDRIDNNKNYAPDNCRFVTPKENIRNSTITNLTIKDIIDIRKFKEDNPKISDAKIAKKYNVSGRTINAIIKRQNWKDV